MGIRFSTAFGHPADKKKQALLVPRMLISGPETGSLRTEAKKLSDFHDFSLERLTTNVIP
jgi:hypothetical protein